MTSTEAKLTLPRLSTGVYLPALGVPKERVFGARRYLVNLQTAVVLFKLNNSWFDYDLI